MRRSLARRIVNSARPRAAASLTFVRHYAVPIEKTPEERAPAVLSGAQEPDYQLGDYPQLPWETTQLRPAKGWWDLQMRRNFGETIHEEDDALNMWAPDPPVIPPSLALRQFALAWAGIAGLGYVIYLTVPERPAVPREYPYGGLIKELGGLEIIKANTEVDSEDE